MIFVTDFFIKSYLKTHFAFQSIPLIKNVLHITVVFNQGAAFGIMQGYSNILIYIGLIFLIVIVVMLARDAKRNLISNIAFGLILGGALSNMFDRIIYGFVVDYIDLRVWPVFNLSDMCISVGVGILIVKSFIKNGKEHSSS